MCGWAVLVAAMFAVFSRFKGWTSSFFLHDDNIANAATTATIAVVLNLSRGVFNILIV
jgi:hypothetical protein